MALLDSIAASYLRGHPHVAGRVMSGRLHPGEDGLTFRASGRDLLHIPHADMRSYDITWRPPAGVPVWRRVWRSLWTSDSAVRVTSPGTLLLEVDGGTPSAGPVVLEFFVEISDAEALMDRVKRHREVAGAGPLAGLPEDRRPPLAKM